MRATQIEIKDSLGVVQFNATITTGSYYVVTASSIIRAYDVYNPKIGPRQNDPETYLEVSGDGGNNWNTIARGSTMSIDGKPQGESILIRSNYNGANAEVTLLVEC